MSISSFRDKAIGLYHFLSDRTPRNVPVVDPKPRAINPWCKNGQALVAKVRAGEDVRLSVNKAIALLAITQVRARDMFGYCIAILIMAIIPYALGLTFIPY